MLNRNSKKSNRDRKSIDKISTTNSTIRFKDIMDKNMVKLNSNIYIDKKNFFPQKKMLNESTKKIKSAFMTPQ
jgi:hypothetical protein